MFRTAINTFFSTLSKWWTGGQRQPKQKQKEDSSGNPSIQDDDQQGGCSPRSRSSIKTTAKKREADFSDTFDVKSKRPRVYAGTEVKKQEIKTTAGNLMEKSKLGPTLPSSQQKSFSEIYGIPAPPKRSVLQQVSYATGVTEVFFNIKTRGQKITQIAARGDDGTINVFVTSGARDADNMPKRPGSQGQDDRRSSEDNGQVRTLPLPNALEELCAFLEQRGNNVLLGHNIQNSCLLLFRALHKYGMLKRFKDHVKGFVDTLMVFKKTHSGLQSYKQENLVHLLLGKDEQAKDAGAGALNLQQLVRRAKIETDIKQKASFTADYVQDCLLETLRVETNLPSLEKLFKEDPTLKKIAEKVAGSGLKAGHLEKVHKIQGREGIKNVFTEKVEGRPRITTQEATISLVANCFELSRK